MKQIAKFTVGSNVFFNGLEGFTPKDQDALYIMDSWISKNATQLRMRVDNIDKILAPKLTKKQYIDDCLHSDTTMRMGKFFVPAFAEYIGLEVEDLKVFEKYLDILPDNHKYYKKIYEAYMENGNFTMTDEQRNAAFEEYKKYRKNYNTNG